MGQRFILLLARTDLILHKVGASSRSVGKTYKDAVQWRMDEPLSMGAGELLVRECKASEFEDCDLVFSGLDSVVAGTIGKSGLRIHS